MRRAPFALVGLALLLAPGPRGEAQQLSVDEAQILVAFERKLAVAQALDAAEAKLAKR